MFDSVLGVLSFKKSFAIHNASSALESVMLI